ncbi:MAG: IS4 family transposase, partial [Phormidesmis sp.]
MIPSIYQSYIERQLSDRQSLLLSLLVTVIHSIRDVRLETIAEALPLPILFESRRKKVQRFLRLGAMDVNRMWLGLFAVFLEHQPVATGSTVYVAIDRTTWGNINLLMVSLIWRKRAIPLYWQRLKRLGNSNLTTQKKALRVALSALSAYKVVVLGDREFCGVDLARWLGEQKAYFCLRQKKSTHIQSDDQDWIALSQLGLTPGTSCFFNQITVTESKGFGPVQLAGKWKRRYDGFAPDEPWFILTNLDSLDAAISAYQKRFSIEEMFRDLKSGGYCLEKTRVEGKRFLTLVLLVAIAYTCVTTQGQQLKQKALQKYIARPETKGRTHKRHSAFYVGLAAYRWVPFWPRCQQQIQALLRLDRNKIDYHLRVLRAIEAVLSTLKSLCHPLRTYPP